ncbi:UNVERIFIED_CONTAM: hypothetical protein PYX00_008804 [Menopon gallinae]|uniref:Ig-like domain-containing protein n=1 Tax=Menopon gallinae TaxID=328185 RepID=A0AAW2HPS5_9NEOP
MASGAFLLCVLIVKGFLSVHCTDKSTEQTGLYFVKQPEDVIVVKGEPLILPCSANSTNGKELNLIWLHNGSPVLPDGRRRILLDGSLSITKILHKKNGHSDEGQYRCIISDGNGYLTSKFASVRISTMPNFTEHPKSHDVREGSHVQMTCKVNSTSEGVITWERDDNVLLGKTSKRVILSGPGINGSIIYIFNVGFEDQGKYRCIFTSSLLRNERQSRRATLTVKPKEKWESPKFLSSSDIRIVKEGDRLPLDCVVNGYPFPILVWRYRRKSDNNAIQIFNSTNTGHNIVYIDNITHEHSGLYSCSASISPEMEITLEVRVMTHPEFIVRPETVTYQAARAVRFRCKVVGNPVPTILWVKDGYPVRISGKSLCTNSVWLEYLSIKTG